MVAQKFMTLLRACITMLTAYVVPCVIASAPPVPPAEPSIALLTKVVLDVTRTESGKDVWQHAQRGETLSSGDRIQTGHNSFAIIKFKDNSVVHVRQHSELTVTGETSGGAFSKSVHVNKGSVGFNVERQHSAEQFRFTSPSSAASIRGTRGKFIVHDGADTLIVIGGSVELQSLNSSKSISVQTGYTGISLSNGTILAHPSTPEEQLAAERASRPNDQDGRLEFDLRDRLGNTKKLVIDFTQ